MEGGVGGVNFYLDAQTLAFNKKMAAANRQLQKLGVTAGTVSKKSVAATTAMTTGAARLEKAYLRVRTVMVSVGVSLATIAGLAAMGKLLTAASEFETAFAGVQKTVDATAEELAGLSAEIRQMAKEIPLTTTELSKIGEVGGQLGISVQNMGKFIDVIAKLGVATTMTIDDAAMSVARFAAIMNTSEKDYERLASTLVHLGNNFAATEQEIMTMALRVAGAGKQVGMTEDQVLSFATALTAVGIRAEAGGTAISRVMIEIDKQVAKAGEKLRIFAEVAGMSVESFTRLWQTDATAALVKFIEGLSRLKEENGNVSLTLEELGLGAVRVSDTLRRASASTELLNKALEYGATGWRENIALTREAEIRFATMASQFKMLLSRINDIAISIGTHLLPKMFGIAKVLVVVAEQTWLWTSALTILLSILGVKIITALVSYSKALYSNATAVALVRDNNWRLGLSSQSVILGFKLQSTSALVANRALYGYAGATKVATAGTLTFASALSVLWPILGVMAAIKLVEFLWDFVPALKANVKELNALGTAATFNIKQYQERLDALGVSYETTAKAQTNAWTGVITWGKNLLASVGIMDSATEGTVRYEEHLKDLLLQFTNLDLIMVTGKGTWDDYYTTVAQAPDQIKTVNLLMRELIKDYAHFTATGGKHTVWVGDNIEQLEALIGVMHIFGDETAFEVQILKRWIEEFDLAAWEVETLGRGIAKLTEEQKKLYESVDIALHPMRKYTEELEQIKQINEDAGRTIVNLTNWYKLNAKAIVDAAKKQEKLGVALSKADLELLEIAKTFLKVEGAVKNVEEATNKYADAFKKALNPTIELGKKIRALKAAGYDASTIVRVLGKDVIKTADDARKFNQTVDKSVEELEDLARALIPPTHEMSKLDFQMISTGDSQENLNKITTQLVPKMGDLQEAFRYLGLEAKHAKAPVDLLAESLEKGWVLQLDKLNMLPGVVAEQINEMSTAGLNASQIMHLFGGSIKEAAEWLILLDRPLTEAEQGIVDIAATATDTSKIIKKQISTIITDLGKGFADIIVEWKGLWTSLKDIAKDFAKGILRIFFESLFTPIMQGFSTILSGGGFGAGFNAAGGFGGITGIFKALGGLFTGGGGGGTAGYGGFTDAAAGMTMMDTAATGASSSLTALTTNFTKLGAAIKGGATSMWQWLTTGIAGGPWGLAIAGAAAAAVVLWKTVFSKSAYEKFAQEFARDFGDIVISDDAIKNFTNSLGVTEEQLAKVRKDVASSPAFLMIGYNAAKAQGKVEQFLKSLESIETAWGTFDFREAFEEGLATGNWLDLNEAFVEAFGTDLLKDIFGEDLKGLLIEMDEEFVRLILRTRELESALETLRDEPVRVAQGLAAMVESIQILRDAGATDAEVMRILGEDIEIVVAAAHELGIEIPQVIQDLLNLNLATSGVSEAFQQGYAIWGNIIDQGENLSDTIMGLGAKMLELYDVAEAQEMTWKFLGGDILDLANSYIQLGMDIPPVIQATLDWAEANGHARRSADGLYHAMGKLSSAYQEGQKIWTDFAQSAWDLQDKLMGLGDALLEEYDVATAQRMAWEFLGDEIISTANAYEEAGRTLPPVIQAALEFAKAAGYIQRNAEGAWEAVEGLTEALSGLNEQQAKGLQAWEDTLTATQELADFMEGWMLGGMGTLGLDMGNVDDAAQMAMLTWDKFGDQVISKANEMISSGLGEFIDSRTLQMLEWAQAMGLVAKGADGMWKAINQGSGLGQEKPYWIQNWEAEMAAIYGSDWKRKLGYATGPEVPDFGGEIPEFPFPDQETTEDFGRRVVELGRNMRDTGYETDELGRRIIHMRETSRGAGEALGGFEEHIRRIVGISRRGTDSARGFADELDRVNGASRRGIDGLRELREQIDRTFSRRGSSSRDAVETGELNSLVSSNGTPPDDSFLDFVGSTFSGLPMMQAGMNFVPQDMIAMLHKGERVIPASENKAGGYKSSGVNVNITIQGPVYGLDDLDRKIANSVRKTFKAGGLSFLGDS